MLTVSKSMVWSFQKIEAEISTRMTPTASRPNLKYKISYKKCGPIPGPLYVLFIFPGYFPAVSRPIGKIPVLHGMAELPVQDRPDFFLRPGLTGGNPFHVFLIHDFFRFFFSIHPAGIPVRPGFPCHFLRSFHGMIPFLQ